MKAMLVASLMIVAVSGCVGAIDDSAEAGDVADHAVPVSDRAPAAPGASASAGAAGAPAAFSNTCSGTPAPRGWNRLTSDQYANTLRDLSAFALGAASTSTDVNAVMAALPVDSIPPDRASKGVFGRLGNDVGDDHVRGQYLVAVGFGKALTTPARIGKTLGPCSADAGACLAGFIKRFGERALRRPLTTEEVAFYQGFYGDVPGVDAAGVADVIAGIVLAPEFLYQAEYGDGNALMPFELAARLSYHFWDSMPDAELFEAARSGALGSSDAYTRQVDRLFSSDRARKVLQTFYRQWLRLDDLASLDSFTATKVGQAIAGKDVTPGAQLRNGFIDDALDLVGYYTWDRPGGVDDLLTSNLVFPRSDDVARIYATPKWTPGAGEPPQAAGRPGLLTRAAFLVSGTPNTRPILKGAFIRQQILCDTIPPPPANAAIPIELSDGLSTRQTVEALTETPGTLCAGCHASLINPLGFATEGFDALGRPRSEQVLYAKTDAKVLGRAAIDTHGVPQVVAGDVRESSGAADLMKLIAESGKLSACLVRNYYRYTFRRPEDLDANGCTLEPMRRTLDHDGSLASALRSVALTRAFQERLP